MPNPIKIDYKIFVPVLSLSILVVISGIGFNDGFVETIKGVNAFILDRFGWLFTYSSFSFLLLIVGVYFSKLGGQTIGGKGAIPLLPKWRWFSITLCTTLATGLLFWGMAEPLYHLNTPPEGIDVKDSARFAMSTMFMHWSFTPYAIYTVTGLCFALVYYNKKQPFSIAALGYPIMRAKTYGLFGTAVDIFCLFSLVAGMSASLGAGILAISGGMDQLLGIEPSSLIIGLIGMSIVIIFILSSITGLQKGIRILSGINMIAFGVLILVILYLGNTMGSLSLVIDGLKDYGGTFLQRSLGLSNEIDQQWYNDWTIFYFANWFAWAPVAALFLGRISYGYTVRSFIHMNLILPSLFAIAWLGLFSGNTMLMDQAQQGAVYQLMTVKGEESVMYYVFHQLTGSNWLGLFALITVFLSYVTAADSNVSAMSAISTTGVSPEQPEGGVVMKVIWGVLIGLISCIMIISIGIDGIRILSVLGGAFAFVIVAFSAIGLIRMIYSR